MVAEKMEMRDVTEISQMTYFIVEDDIVQVVCFAADFPWQATRDTETSNGSSSYRKHTHQNQL